MKPITLRNIPDRVARIIRRKAAAEGVSLNRAVIAVLEQAVGGGGRPSEQRYHDLDELAGAWTQEEAEEFERALAEQRRIEPELWR